MTIAKLGSFTGAWGSVSSGTTATRVVHTVSGSIPAGSTIVVMGIQVSQSGTPPYVRGVIDSKGNPYAIRVQPATPPGAVVADCCQIPTALANGDTISIQLAYTDGMYVYGGGWFSPCMFDKLAVATWAGTAAAGGLINTLVANELLLGLFNVYNGSVNNMASMTAGPGYTAGAGVGYGSGSGPDWGPSSISTNWESKIGGSAGPETATATMSTTGPVQHAATVAYYETFSNQMVGVV